MDKISCAFKNKNTNIGFILAGYPNLEHSRELLLNLDKTKIDLLEIGVPYSDPLADDKFIAEASFLTAQNSFGIKESFELMQSVKYKVNKPIIFVIYFNLIFSYGLENFVKKSKEVGISGLIVPDLPFEECEELVLLCKKYDVAFVPLISVTSDKNRMKNLIQFGSEFVCVLENVVYNGSQNANLTHVKELVKTLKQISNKPIAVGFDSTNQNNNDKIQEFADASIIKTQIVRLCAEFKGDELIEKINKLF